MIAGVLLTGGRSRRLGVDKARVELDGETLATRTARVLAEVCDPCLEVGSGASTLRCISEKPPGQGPLAAFVSGVRALQVEPAAGAAALLLACDMPLMTTELLSLLAGRAASTVIPVARARPQYGCAKYGAGVLGAMIAASDAGTRSFKWLQGSELHDDIEWIDESVWGEVATTAAFRDLDTRDDAAVLGIRIP